MKGKRQMFPKPTAKPILANQYSYGWSKVSFSSSKVPFTLGASATASLAASRTVASLSAIGETEFMFTFAGLTSAKSSYYFSTDI